MHLHACVCVRERERVAIRESECAVISLCLRASVVKGGGSYLSSVTCVVCFPPGLQRRDQAGAVERALLLEWFRRDRQGEDSTSQGPAPGLRPSLKVQRSTDSIDPTPLQSLAKK